MNPQDKNLDREGGKKCTYPRCACDSKAACTVPQAGAAVASPHIIRAVALGEAARYVDDLQASDEILTFNVIADGIRALAGEHAHLAKYPAPTDTGDKITRTGNVLTCTTCGHSAKMADPYGAAGAGEVKGKDAAQWYVAYCEKSEKLKAADGAIERYAKKNADLRAQLALALQQRNQTLDDLARAHAQLARQRQETDAALVESEQLKAYRASDRAYIEELEATARQHQDSKPTDLSKRLRDASCNSGCTYANMTLFLQAADEIERLAAAQGEPVATPKYQVWQVEPASCWCDVSKAEFDAAGGTKRIVYTTPPAAQAVPGDEVRDAKRWRILVEQAESDSEAGFQLDKRSFLRLGADNKGMLAAAADRALALRATKTEGEEQQ